MRRPARVLAVGVLLPFLTGCFATQMQSLAEAPEPRPTNISGVVLTGDGESDERIEFDRVDHVEWTDSTLIVTGVPKAEAGSEANGTAETRTFALTSVSSVLVKEVDPSKTSIIIGAIGVGAIAVAALLLTGQADTYRD